MAKIVVADVTEDAANGAAAAAGGSAGNSNGSVAAGGLIAAGRSAGTPGGATVGPRSILVVGSGGREHALAWALRRSPSVERIFAAPGNPGIAALAETVPILATDIDALTAWAVERRIDLVVIGPEAPLALGLADRLTERGVPVFGPSRAAAELEWSKAFAKRFLRDHGIPTADAVDFDDADAALAYAASAAYPLVVKADGLAAGKGVTVCSTPTEANAAIRAALVEGAFGAAGARVLVEAFLCGRELSVIALCDGERIACLPPARDYKRLGDGDTGPNTGGMGSYAPVPEVDAALLDRVVQTVLRPTVDGLRRMGRPYRGALYAGLMLTDAGPQVIEFNCRFGDPETQALLPLLDGDVDLARLLLACATGRLDPAALRWQPGFATCVTLAAGGYPERTETGAAISGLDLDRAAATGALVFHAGTACRDGELVVANGRVLSVVGRGETLADASAQAYAAAAQVAFAGCRMRRDVGVSEEDGDRAAMPSSQLVTAIDVMRAG